jgi:agmatine deiminase
MNMQRSPCENTVYVSKILAVSNKFSKTYRAFASKLMHIGASLKELENTADVWCRDFMPIKTGDGRFVQFRYDPSYLKGFPALQTNPELVWNSLGLSVEKSPIFLDGGNVLRCENLVLISDRVFDENLNHSKTELLNTLEKSFNAEILIFPQVKSDLTGHVDGLARFINPSTILINDRLKEYKYWARLVEKFAKEHQLTLVDMPFFHKSVKGFPHNALGCYLNYLELPNDIVMPVFEVGGDINDSALNKLEEVFPNKKIHPVEATELALHGGVFNCATWSN